MLIQIQQIGIFKVLSINTKKIHNKKAAIASGFFNNANEMSAHYSNSSIHIKNIYQNLDQTVYVCKYK
jgi:hypothetical protein